MRLTDSFAPVVFVCLAALACEGEKPAASETASASAAAAVPSTPPPPPTPPRKPDAGAPKKAPRECKPGPVVDFGGDAALEAQVRLKLSKEKGDIKVSELGKVRSLNLSQAKMKELDRCVVPHMKTLKELFLGPGRLKDLSPISELTGLEALRASLNPIESVEPLAKLTKMDRLDLGHTRVTDLKPLAGMEALTELQLDDTPVSDLTPLAKMTKLERLSIQRTNVKDVSALRGLTSLKFLYTSGAPIDDLSVLGPLTARGLKIVQQ